MPEKSLAVTLSTYRQTAAKLSTLLNCSRPDLPAQSLLVSALTGAAFASLCLILSLFQNEAGTIRGFLAAGLWLAAPYAILKASGRIDKGAQVLFAGGDPVLLALGFHDRRLAVGLTGGTVLHALASIAGTIPVLVLIGTSVFIPIGRLLAVSVAVAAFAAGTTALFATSRLVPIGKSIRSPWWFRLTITVVIGVGMLWASGVLTFWRTPAIDPASAVGNAILALVAGTGLHAVFLLGAGEPVPAWSIAMPIAVGVLAAIRSLVKLAAIPEDDTQSSRKQSPPPAAARPATPLTVTPPAPPKRSDSPPDLTADRPARAVAATSEQADSGPRGSQPQPAPKLDPGDGVDRRPPPPASVPATAPPPRETQVKRTPPVRFDRSVERRPSVRWPETNLYNEWNTRILPASNVQTIKPVVIGFVSFETLLIGLGLFAIAAKSKDGLYLFNVVFWTVAAIAAAIVLWLAVRIPKHLLASQLSGGTEALVLAGISPRTLVTRSLFRAMILSLGVIGSVVLLTAVQTAVIEVMYSRWQRFPLVGWGPLLVFGIWAVGLAVALPAASALGAIWRSSELVRTILLLVSIALGPFAAVLFIVAVLAAASDFTDDRNRQQGAQD